MIFDDTTDNIHTLALFTEDDVERIYPLPKRNVAPELLVYLEEYKKWEQMKATPRFIKDDEVSQ